MWHLQNTRLTARWFAAGKSYEQRDPPDVIAQVDLRSDGTAYIHATMSRKDSTASPGIWRDLARQLRALGVTLLQWEHKGKSAAIDPHRAWADTVAQDR